MKARRAQGGKGREQRAIRRARKKGNEEEAKFSPSFLDKEQWKMIKAVAEDALVTQIVILSQKPLFTCTSFRVRLKSLKSFQRVR